MLAAEAELTRAQQQLEETQTILSYAVIASPIDGLVIDKRVEAGDTVSPGQVLVKLYDQKRMQLVASARESLTQRLKVGQSLPVAIDALAWNATATSARSCRRRSPPAGRFPSR